jgi:hypothetical protein
VTASALAQKGHSGHSPQRRAAQRSNTCSAPGTCVPDCRLYGKCHCLCGQPTTIAKWSQHSHGYVGGRYFRYRWQHYHPKNPYDGDKCGVPYAAVAGMVEALWSELRLHGTAEQVGVSWRAVSMWHNGHMKYVQRRTAANIERAFNNLDRALRKEQIPTAPMREFLARRGLSGEVFPDKTHRRYSYRPTVSVIVADEMACSLGYHPSEIWKDWFD